MMEIPDPRQMRPLNVLGFCIYFNQQRQHKNRLALLMRARYIAHCTLVSANLATNTGAVPFIARRSHPEIARILLCNEGRTDLCSLHRSISSLPATL